MAREKVVLAYSGGLDTEGFIQLLGMQLIEYRRLHPVGGVSR